MIWTLKMKFCNVEPECHHLIEIDANASLIDLHMAIQDAANFDNDHLFEFFLGRHPRNRAVKIGNRGGWGDFAPYESYETVQLSDVFPLPAKGLKLFYLFDFGDSWYFQITKTRRKEKDPEPGVSYPRVIETKGGNPAQYPEQDQNRTTAFTLTGLDGVFVHYFAQLKIYSLFNVYRNFPPGSR